MATAELARRRLIDFAAHIDPAVGDNYKANHLRRIALKLEAVERGEIKRLFITCPPRHWKSSLASEKFPAWYLGRNPNKAVILASYAVSLAEKFSRNVRDCLVFNERFHELFPDVKLRDDSRGVHDWALKGAPRSSFRAVGVGGGITGHGAQLIVIDDPVADAMDSGSQTQRDKLWDWYQQTLRTRLEPGGAIVLIMSRWHEDDLAGRLLRASSNGDGEQWERLELPALSQAGVALWPERWPAHELERIRIGIGSRAFAAQFQGSPRVDAGGILDSRKLRMVEAEQVPRLLSVVRRWDLAFSDRQGADYVAGAKLGRDVEGNVYILNVKRINARWTASKPLIVETAIQDGMGCKVAIEANGTQLGYFQDVQGDPRMQTYTVLADKPEGTKEMRASVWGSRLDDGIIRCVRANWNEALFDEMDSFPNGQHDDMVDAVSGAWSVVVAPSFFSVLA